jgi:hypothetical protein
LTLTDSLRPRVLDAVRPEVNRLLAELRPEAAPLRVERVAARLGLALIDHRFRGPVRGATIEDRAVVLDSRLQGVARAEVFAHEVAHVLHRRGHFAALGGSETELFADQFAREFLVPSRWLANFRYPAPRLARQLGVSYALFALQLAVSGAAPSLMLDRETVLCVNCGIRLHDRRCVCRSFREDRHSRRRLHDFRALPAFQSPASRQLSLQAAPSLACGRSNAV